ncbi:hypothetical protein P154DRAFT_623360 [Amniculicola lignicola CBS 123094]|uniref:Uncharacterized protein n=1 Tax=Amniculicola lignicola CBS 123094 TaxID=1392246 RepID=A0A6A5WAY0_9PLEO|nr:hypothetical protein P154DRAFT_623360 [Amniculicola lignicola CBS 123094]
MGKSASEATGGQSGKMFSADVVAALIMSFGQSSISRAQYELMSAMDGVKTASAFQHDFRAVLAKARELKARQDAGEKFEAVQPGTKRGFTAMSGGLLTPPVTPSKKPKAAAGAGPKARPKPRKKQEATHIVDEQSPDVDQHSSPSPATYSNDGFYNYPDIKEEPEFGTEDI